MVDWKKEIKLSDLARRKPKPERVEPRQSEPAREQKSFWKKELSFGRKSKPEVAHEAPPGAVAPAAAAPEPAPVGAAPEPARASLPEPSVELPPVEPPQAAEVELPPEPEAVAESPTIPPTFAATVPPPPKPGLNPPVPASELPPLPVEQPEPRKPLLKREFPFRRKPVEEQSPPETEPKKSLLKHRKAVEEPTKPRKPLLKRELSFGRRRREAEPWDEDVPPERKRLHPPKLSLPAFRRPSLPGPALQGRRRQLVGLKLGGSQVAAAQVVSNGSVELVQAAREPLEPGVIVGGELRDPEALTVALRQFFRKHKLPRRAVRLGIANNRIGVRIFDVGGIDDAKRLENAIRFRAQEVLPIPIEEAVLDYQVLGQGVDAEGAPTHRVLLVVAYRELIDRYVAACRAAGVRLVGIDLEAFALLRALAAPRDEAAGPAQAALVVVSIGHDRSTFAVSDGRVCEFTRVLAWGGATLDVAVARALDTAPSEAEPIKRAISLAGPEPLPPGVTEEQATEAREAIRRELQSFARELVSSLRFYQNQPGSLGIGEIVITGGTAQLSGLADELQRMIGVAVRVGDPLVRVKPGKRVRTDDQLGSLAIAIGLGIED